MTAQKPKLVRGDSFLSSAGNCFAISEPGLVDAIERQGCKVPRMPAGVEIAYVDRLERKGQAATRGRAAIARQLEISSIQEIAGSYAKLAGEGLLRMIASESGADLVVQSVKPAGHLLTLRHDVLKELINKQGRKENVCR